MSDGRGMMGGEAGLTWLDVKQGSPQETCFIFMLVHTQAGGRGDSSASWRSHSFFISPVLTQMFYLIRWEAGGCLFKEE